MRCNNLWKRLRQTTTFGKVAPNNNLWKGCAKQQPLERLRQTMRSRFKFSLVLMYAYLPVQEEIFFSWQEHRVTV
jgi:hypothetical protein